MQTGSSLPTALPAQASRPRDDCWNQVRPDGADPREADTLADTEEDLARVERHFISTGPDSRMRAQVTQPQRQSGSHG